MLLTIRNFLLAAIVALQIYESTQLGPKHNKVVVCYVSTWAVYRPSKGSFTLDDIDPTQCTHLIYAFAGLDIMQNHIKSLDPWQDLPDDYGKDGFNTLTKLRNNYPHLKITLAIGGWNEGSVNYSKLASDPERRSTFVKQSLEFIRKYKFDGLDLDWEYPANRGGNPEDKENFVHLVRELKTEYQKYGLIVTSAIGAAKNTIDTAYDIPELSKYLDFLHIMCYDYGGAWDKRVTANAPLKNDGVLSVEYTIEYLMQLGAPASKIVVGLPFYGRTFISELEGRLGDSADSVGFKGPYTNENGFMGYNEICSALENSTFNWTKEWHDDSSEMVARYLDPVTGKGHAVTYDTTRSIANKIRFVVRKDLAGAMSWSIDTDDFKGICPEETDTYVDFGHYPGVKLNFPTDKKGRFKLLKTINEAFIIANNEWQQEKDLELAKKQAEMDRENEIPHGPHEHHNAGSVSRAFLGVVVLPFVLLIAAL
ncbi:probable chitinase 2 [Culicoides brevitarsis]|uniref:probable chitinase 2 n=1 Tax=Culicoides brevitarsis TaxID=469753 RepID=UPI00307B3ACC